MNYRRIGRWAAGVGAVAVAGAGLYWLKERTTEKADYVTVEEDGVFELRRYPPILVARTVQPGGRDRALGQGFGVLAGYIFAEHREGDEIAMTAPVLAERTEGRGWTVSFVMPKAYTRDTLPTPDAGIEIELIAARRVATIRFPGKADDALLAEKSAQLAAWIKARGLEPVGGVEHAFFNSPFIPGPLKHNEVWQAVV
ncbi:SOUL family heme-binding protein [Sphingomonas arantia]|uniref:SOUL family heme-binding protein n=1 Tax=Sphingomonas arantia TaxID=1460676 RepID=A0ABW4U3T7_9SPHN